MPVVTESRRAACCCLSNATLTMTSQMTGWTAENKDTCDCLLLRMRCENRRARDALQLAEKTEHRGRGRRPRMFDD